MFFKPAGIFDWINSIFIFSWRLQIILYNRPRVAICYLKLLLGLHTTHPADVAYFFANRDGTSWLTVLNMLDCD